MTRKRTGDGRLERAVRKALQRYELDGAQIRLTATTGVVTLRGYVATLADRLTIGRLVGRVGGVRGVANEIVVRSIGSAPSACAEIARAALALISWNILIPTDAVRVVVSDGWITLEGLVDWQYQKHLAGREVRGIAGVRGVTNAIVVRGQLATGRLDVSLAPAVSERIH